MHEKDDICHLWNPITQKDSLLKGTVSFSNSEYFIHHIENQTFLKNVKCKTILSGKLKMINLHDQILNVKKVGKYGLILHSQIIVPFEYDSIVYQNKELICLQKDQLWKIVQYKKDSLLTLENQVDSISIFFNAGDLYLIIVKKNKYGFISYDGSILLPCRYTLDLTNGVVKWISTNKKQHNYAFIKTYGALISYRDNQNFTVINKIRPDDLYYVNNYFQSFEFHNITQQTKNGKVGLMNSEKKWIIPPMYDSLEFSDGENLVIAKKGSKWGVIDFQNKIHLLFKYENISN